MEVPQGKSLKHLNLQNKQKETCQEKDTQNSKDNVSLCFMMIRGKKIRLLRLKRL